MYTRELEQLLIESLKDFKLDQDEKYMFKGFSETLPEDQLRFIRNKAFELSRAYIEPGGKDALRVLNWLERVVKAIQPLKKTLSIKPQAYFSPGSDCRDKIINCINGAKRTIDICVFTISDNKITHSIYQAHKRGVLVTIISDNDKANDRGSDIYSLADKGIEVILDQSPYHMHHKFALIDNSVLINGSFNWTRSASDVNEENIIISSDACLLSSFSERFADLKSSLSKLRV